MSRLLGKVHTKTFTLILIVLAAAIGVLAVLRLDTTGKTGSGLSEAYVYDVEHLTQIDPNLILFEESPESIATGFKAAHAICIDPAGRICVGGDKAIRIFSDAGDRLGEIELEDSPRCLTTADDGTFYIGMKDHVEVYDAQGKRRAAWKSLGDDAVLTSIAVSNNNVFVADAGNRIVVRYDISGKTVNRIGGKDKDRNIPGFVIPSPYFDLTVARDGLLRVVNPGRHRIEAYTFDGDLEFSWGKFSSGWEGFTGCCNPVNFDILADDGFVTVEKGLVRAKIYDASGGFVGVVAGPKQLVREGDIRICELPDECQAGGFDVAVDSKDRIFVLDTIKNVVRIFTRKKGAL
jgi:hypothetical protein